MLQCVVVGNMQQLECKRGSACVVHDLRCYELFTINIVNVVTAANLTHCRNCCELDDHYDDNKLLVLLINLQLT